MKKIIFLLFCVLFLGTLDAQNKNEWILLESTIRRVISQSKVGDKSQDLYLLAKSMPSDRLKGDSVLHYKALPDFVQTDKLSLIKLKSYQDGEVLKSDFISIIDGKVEGIVTTYETTIGNESSSCYRHVIFHSPIIYDNLGVISVAEMNEEAVYALLPSTWREGANVVTNGAMNDPFSSAQYEATLSPTWEVLRGSLLIENFHCTYFNYVAGEKKEAQYLLRELSIKNSETGEFTCLGVILEKFKGSKLYTVYTI